MPDKPGEPHIDSHEQKNIVQVSQAADAHSMNEVLDSRQVVARVGDHAPKLNDGVYVAEAGDGAIAKTNPADYTQYASARASMPLDGPGSVGDLKNVVDYFKQAYPMNNAFNTGVEKAVFT
jgi:hypothetical protein